MSGALMRRWPFGIYADHMERTRREESLRPFSGCAVRASLQGPRSVSAAAAAERGVECPRAKQRTTRIPQVSFKFAI
jgi:hypothetical protein